ncbi:ThuA domain-containing protein [Agromyces sp. SYSU K20354]|uniref:ThuA domain-containing protein n=1 Tax=Agromyces cavernae TaxID=2898659 RepID=UPI001E5BD128|nr:ThuA domain-containing protein [Agromyces cavernae]MCD2443435.1 ThuA domain-containing protein [Agromyces cavernae]
MASHATERAGRASRPRSALVVRGGWEGHDPVGCTELFIPHLETQGFAVEISHDLAVYDDDERLAATDLVVHSWSGGALTAAQESNLVSAVRGGTGFAGWHGGIIGTNVANAAYLRMVGGRFLFHPEGFQDYTVRIEAEPERDGEIVAGLEDFAVHTEQYWVLSDSHNTVLASTVFDVEPGGEWGEPAAMPVTWTRRWGAGRVFVCTLGHRVGDLTQLPTNTMIQRGLLWAARARPIREARQ